MKMRIDIDANIFYQGMKDINKYHMNKTLRIKDLDNKYYDLLKEIDRKIAIKYGDVFTNTFRTSFEGDKIIELIVYWDDHKPQIDRNFLYNQEVI